MPGSRKTWSSTSQKFSTRLLWIGRCQLGLGWFKYLPSNLFHAGTTRKHSTAASSEEAPVPLLPTVHDSGVWFPSDSAGTGQQRDRMYPMKSWITALVFGPWADQVVGPVSFPTAMAEVVLFFPHEKLHSKGLRRSAMKAFSWRATAS